MLRIFFSEFLDILKNDFRLAGAYTPMSQSGFLLYVSLLLVHSAKVKITSLKIKVYVTWATGSNICGCI
jgi:hypothetical protein